MSEIRSRIEDALESVEMERPSWQTEVNIERMTDAVIERLYLARPCRECGKFQSDAIHDSQFDHEFDPWGQKLSEMTCPQCHKPFILTWRDYGIDARTKAFNSGDDSTLDFRGCPSGGIYDVGIECPHCNYREDL